MNSPAPECISETVPNTLAGFKASFFDAGRRPLTEQDIFDAGVRSGMARAGGQHAQSDLYKEGYHAGQADARRLDDSWKLAVDNELVTIGSTADSFASAPEALKALLDWHVSVALDPTVSSDAQALHADAGRYRFIRDDENWQQSDRYWEAISAGGEKLDKTVDDGIKSNQECEEEEL